MLLGEYRSNIDTSVGIDICKYNYDFLLLLFLCQKGITH